VSVGEGSDHLQLIKFLQSCTSGGGLYENFWLRLATASVQCLCLSERFILCLWNAVLETLQIFVAFMQKSLPMSDLSEVNISV